MLRNSCVVITQDHDQVAVGVKINLSPFFHLRAIPATKSPGAVLNSQRLGRRAEGRCL
jgi:hypothetical protein